MARRKSRENPLVGWVDESGRTASDAWEPMVVLVKPGAKEKFAAIYNSVDLPLAVVLRPEGWTPGAAPDVELARKLDAILLVLTVIPRGPTPHYAELGQERGSFERVTPYTPFVVLHRLGDVLSRMQNVDSRLDMAISMLAEIDELFAVTVPYVDARGRQRLRPWWYHPTEMPDAVPVMSRGVDTAAGRMGVLFDVPADLFAKWLLTGRVAYSATNPPPQSPEEADYRNAVAEYMPQIFRLWSAYLRDNIPAVYNVVL